MNQYFKYNPNVINITPFNSSHFIFVNSAVNITYPPCRAHIAVFRNNLHTTRLLKERQVR